MDRFATVVALIHPVLNALLTEGTKQQKSSMIRYWRMYCVVFDI